MCKFAVKFEQKMNYLTLQEALDVVFHGKPLEIPQQAMDEVDRCYRFLEEFHRDKVIYGINTISWTSPLRIIPCTSVHSIFSGAPLRWLFRSRYPMPRMISRYSQEKLKLTLNILRPLGSLLGSAIYSWFFAAGLVLRSLYSLRGKSAHRSSSR